jgi:cytosine/adenosine deaminase-related metal-dependent hydrolase
LEELLKIGCKNGAKALGFSNYGTLEVGKTPGVNLISGFELSLTDSKVQKIV